MSKDYINYVQNVLGAKSIIFPVGIEEDREPHYHFATCALSDEAREILTNIIKALKAKKFDILELKIDCGFEPDTLANSPGEKAKSKGASKSNLIIFGLETAKFLLPGNSIEMGQVIIVAGSKTLLTHSVEEMKEKPELKREAWQHLKVFINQ